MKLFFVKKNWRNPKSSVSSLGVFWWSLLLNHLTAGGERKEEEERRREFNGLSLFFLLRKFFRWVPEEEGGGGGQKIKHISDHRGNSEEEEKRGGVEFREIFAGKNSTTYDMNKSWKTISGFEISRTHKNREPIALFWRSNRTLQKVSPFLSLSVPAYTVRTNKAAFSMKFK